MKGALGYKVRTIVCASCGVEKTGHLRPKQQHCSLDCYRKGPRPSRRTGVEITCEWCGGERYVPRSQEDQRFCSRVCTDAWQGRDRVWFECKTCGGDFPRSPSSERHDNPTYCTLDCRDADPDRRAQLIAMNVAQQRRTAPTRPERIGCGILDELGVVYEPQAVFYGKFCVDACVPAALVVVQFDGDYWHGRKGAGDPRVAKRVELDRSQDAYMRACGWDVLRLWESDLIRHRDDCLRIVRARLAQ